MGGSSSTVGSDGWVPFEGEREVERGGWGSIPSRKETLEREKRQNETKETSMDVEGTQRRDDRWCVRRARKRSKESSVQNRGKKRTAARGRKVRKTNYSPIRNDGSRTQTRAKCANKCSINRGSIAWDVRTREGSVPSVENKSSTPPCIVCQTVLPKRGWKTRKKNRAQTTTETLGSRRKRRSKMIEVAMRCCRDETSQKIQRIRSKTSPSRIQSILVRQTAFKSRRGKMRKQTGSTIPDLGITTMNPLGTIMTQRRSFILTLGSAVGLHHEASILKQR